MFNAKMIKRKVDMTNETAFVYRLPVASLSWSSDSTRLLSTGDENTVIIWDVTTGKTLLRYKGHRDSVSSAAWSPDEQDIASAGKDKTVQIFNAKTGKTIFTYKGHQQDIFRCCLVTFWQTARLLRYGGQRPCLASPLRGKTWKIL